MKKCNICKSISDNTAIICKNCNNSLQNNYTYICDNCGKILQPNSKFCSRCGNEIKLSHTDNNTYTSKRFNISNLKNSNLTLRNILVSAIILLCISFTFDVITHFTDSDKTKKKQANISQEIYDDDLQFYLQDPPISDIPEITNEKQSNLTKKDSQEKSIKSGYITANDVFLRVSPTTNSTPIKTLSKGTKVYIHDTSTNENTGQKSFILKYDNINAIDVDTKQSITLNKGLAMQLVGFGKGPDRAIFNIITSQGQRKILLINNSKNGVYDILESTSSKDWYNIEISDGTTGWVYSKYVKFN